jgi:hypothetical protein
MRLMKLHADQTAFTTAPQQPAAQLVHTKSIALRYDVAFTWGSRNRLNPFSYYATIQITECTSRPSTNGTTQMLLQTAETCTSIHADIHWMYMHVLPIITPEQSSGTGCRHAAVAGAQAAANMHMQYPLP